MSRVDCVLHCVQCSVSWRVVMRAAVALLESRVKSGAADLYRNYDEVSADKRLLLQRTVDSIAALDSGSRRDDNDNGTAVPRADNILPLLTLLPLADGAAQPNDDATRAQADRQPSSDDTRLAKAAAVDVLAVDARYERGLADGGCCDGRWLIRAVVRSRVPHPLHAVALMATAADQRAELVCHATVVDSLLPSSIVCLLCAVDVLSTTLPAVLSIRTLLTVSHSSNKAALARWSRRVQLPRFPHPSQHVQLLAPTDESVSADVSTALSSSPLSSAAATTAQPISLHLDGCPPFAALSSLLQLSFDLRPVTPTPQPSKFADAAAAHLTASDELLVSAPSSTSLPSACLFPGLCCVLSAVPSVGSSSRCWLRLYSESDAVALSFLCGLRAALPASCGTNVTLSDPVSLDHVHRAMAAMIAEAEGGVRQQPRISVTTALGNATAVRNAAHRPSLHTACELWLPLIAAPLCCRPLLPGACCAVLSQLACECEIGRLWREMDLPAVVGSRSAVRHKQHATPAALETHTTQSMIERYYGHIDSRLSLQQATDERVLAVHSMAAGTDQWQWPAST